MKYLIIILEVLGALTTLIDLLKGYFSKKKRIDEEQKTKDLSNEVQKDLEEEAIDKLNDKLKFK